MLGEVSHEFVCTSEALEEMNLLQCGRKRRSAEHQQKTGWPGGCGCTMGRRPEAERTGEKW